MQREKALFLDMLSQAEEGDRGLLKKTTNVKI